MIGKGIVFICIGLMSFLGDTSFAADKATVTIALAKEIASMTPYRSKNDAELPLHQCIFQSLLGPVSETGAWVPWLAETVELMANSRDIRVTLRKDAMFHTGDPVTAEDVRFTWKLFTDEKRNPNTYARNFRWVGDIEIIDDHNLIIRCSRPTVDWKRLMQNWYVGSRKYYEEAGEKNFFSNPVGSGPFRFIGRSPEEKVVLEAVVGYPLNQPAFNTLIFEMVPDQVTRTILLETGFVDLIYDISRHDMKRLQRLGNIKVKTAQVPSFYGISINTRAHPDLLDRQFRMAMNYAIDRERIVNRLFPEHGYPLHTFGSRAEVGYDPAIRYTYDPAKARELLKKSNYQTGVPINAAYTGRMPNGLHVFEAVQAYAKEVGITFEFRMLEGVMFNTLIRKADPRLMMGGTVWPGSTDPTGRLKLGVLSGSLFTVFAGNKKLDPLIVEQEKIFDKEKRYLVLNDIYRLMHEDPPYIPLFGLKLIYAMTDRIEYTWVNNSNRLLNLHEIKVLK
ncbi:MAG: ABC transporter substrate-binding protein [Pseudomonadota bacterium]